MRRKLQATIEGTGAVLLRCDVPDSVGQGCGDVLTWAIHRGGLRDAYLRRMRLDPGPLAVSVPSGRYKQQAMPCGGLATTLLARLALVRRGEDCVHHADHGSECDVLVQVVEGAA